MPEITEKNVLFVEPSEAFRDLRKLPDKPTRLQKIGGAPASMFVILVLMFPIVSTSILHYRRVWGTTIGVRVPHIAMPSYAPSITITKGVWCQEVIIGAGRNFRVLSIDPPVRRLALVNNDPSRVHTLPAGPANEVNVGSDIRSLRWMIMDDESSSNSTITYELR